MIIKDGTIAKITAHGSMAQSDLRAVSKGNGSGSMIGPPNARTPDPEGVRDKSNP